MYAAETQSMPACTDSLQVCSLPGCTTSASLTAVFKFLVFFCPQVTKYDRMDWKEMRMLT